MADSPSTSRPRSTRRTVGEDADRVRPRPLAAAEQLGPVAHRVRGRRLHDARAGMARRPEHRRRGERASRGLRAQDRRPDRRPLRGRHRRSSRSAGASIGHSFGGLLAQILAGRGVSDATVAIDPAPFRGVLPLPDLGPEVGGAGARQSREPRPRGAAHLRAVPLRVRERGERGARRRSSTTPTRCPGSGTPLFQAATANLNPWTEAKVKSKNPDRGPLLIIDGELDHTVPWAIANASFKKQKRNKGVTEIVKIPGRGHSLDDRPRLAGGRRHRARVRPALREALSRRQLGVVPLHAEAVTIAHAGRAEHRAHIGADHRDLVVGEALDRAVGRRRP